MSSILGDLPSTTDLETIAGGSSGINYIQTNNITKDFESNTTTGWNRYANSVAASTPEVSPGGSPNAAFTLASTASSPLRGSYSGLITKDANNRQGHGVRTDAFSIHNVDIGQPLYISFDYEMSSNYVSGDMGVYISDGTNIISPALVSIPAGKGTMKMAFNATTSTTYRLYFHVSTTSALSYTMKYDTVSVGPQQQLVSAAISDWQSFTLTITGVTSNPSVGSNATSFAYWRRVGDSMEIEYNFQQTTAGSNGSGVYLFSVPSGYSIDTTKVQISTNQNGTTGSVVGNCEVATTTSVSASTAGTGCVVPYNSGNLALYTQGGTTGQLVSVSSANFTLSTNPLYISFNAKIPIVGWSSNIVLASAAEEHASNSSTTDADDSTSFAYGASGSSIPNITATATTTARSKRIRFKTPIQPTDILTFELRTDASGTWVPLYANEYFSAATFQGATGYGITLVTVNSTDVDVKFHRGGRSPTGATFGATGASYSTSDGQWRVRKSASAQLFGTTIPNYSEGTFTVNLNQGAGVGGSNTSFTMAYTKIGKLVTLFAPPKQDIAIGTTAIGLTTVAGTVPAALRPANDIQMFGFRVQNAAAALNVAGMMVVGTDGTIEIRRDGGTNWISGNTSCGWVSGWSISYIASSS